MGQVQGRRAGAERRKRLNHARLYLVVDASPPARALDDFLDAALHGGVDMVQLRDKSMDDEGVVRAGQAFRRVCDEHGALFLVNDRPDLAVACGADGVHAGQGDPHVEELRAVVGSARLVGVSTHSSEQIAAAERSDTDYMAVGPVYETPTKPGVPAVGEALVRHAAEHAEKPFFAIGGIDRERAPSVRAAGARRVAVVRAIRDASDPRAAAEGLRAALDSEVGVGAGR